MEGEGFRLHAYQTPTGVKFYLTGLLPFPVILFVSYILQSSFRPLFLLSLFKLPFNFSLSLPGHPGRNNMDILLKNVYELYSDYVLKNPFYELEQPIHCQQFDASLDKLLRDPK